MVLAEHGMQVVEDKRERYRFTVGTSDDAWLLVSSLYLPSTPRRRASRPPSTNLSEAAEREGGIEIAVAVRRLVALK